MANIPPRTPTPTPTPTSTRTPTPTPTPTATPTFQSTPEVKTSLFLNPSDDKFCYGESIGGKDCNVYAIYMSNCFGGANNNMQIFVNGIFLERFEASKSKELWASSPYAQMGAPEICDRPGKCGGEKGRLFFLNQPSPMPFQSDFDLQGVEISWHDINVAGGLTTINSTANFGLANVLEMFFEQNDYHDGKEACFETNTLNKAFNKEGKWWKIGCPCWPVPDPGPCSIYTDDNYPNILQYTSGGCLAIYRYKRGSKGLTDPKFLPLLESDDFSYGWTNIFPATDNNYFTQFTFFWFPEDTLPVSQDPAPPFAGPVGYYW